MATKADIAGRRQSFNAAGYPQFPVRFEGVTVRPFILPQSLQPALPGFAFQMVTEGFDRESDDDMAAINELAIFGVADSVPEDFRQLVVTHELYEYLFGMTCPQIATKEIELSKALGARQDAYLKFRRDFFKNLIEFVQGKPGYSPEKVSEFRQSLVLFEAAVA